MAIITSRLQKDWYYVTMGFFAWLRHRNAKVRYQFINRAAKRIKLAQRIDIGRLREEVAHVASLTYTADEIAWLKAKFGLAIKDGFLVDEYLEWLKTSKLSAIDIEIQETPEGPELIIEPHGLWCEAMDWETFILPIITYLNGEWVMREAGVTRAQVHAEAMFRHGMKIERLRQYPGLRISSFGLRRQLDHKLSLMIDETTVREIPRQLAGISCVWVAKELDWDVAGTFAHQGPMIYSGLCPQDDVSIRASHMQFMDDWSATFAKRWRTAVPDTFGSKSFFEDFQKPKADGTSRIDEWAKWKVDSGNPFHEGERIEAYIKSLGRDPREMVLNPTDGLTIDTAIALYLTFRDRFAEMLPGIGTNRSNDTGLETSGSFVVKAYEVNGVKLAKLSNNVAKASGHPDAITRLKRIHGYDVTERVECVV